MNSSTHYSNTLEQQRQRFEQLVQQPQQPTAAANPFVHNLIRLGDRLMRFFTADHQVRIWQRTRNGRPVWFAYDPMTNQKRQFFNEQDVRNWLDTRYYE